jgi:hypothetical protein
MSTDYRRLVSFVQIRQIGEVGGTSLTECSLKEGNAGHNGHWLKNFAFFGEGIFRGANNVLLDFVRWRAAAIFSTWD